MPTLAGFLQGVGQQAGYSIDYTRNAAQQQVGIDLQKQQLEAGQLAMDTQKQQAASRLSAMSDLRSAMSDAKGPKEQKAALQKVMFSAMAGNDIQGMQEAGAMIKQIDNEVDRTQADAVTAAGALAKRNSSDASAYRANPTPEGLEVVVKNYLNAGGNPQFLPKPGDKEGEDRFVEQQELQDKEGIKKKEFFATLQEKKDKLKSDREAKDASLASLNEQRRATNAIQQGNQQLRAAMMQEHSTEKADKLAFGQTEKLNATAQKEAKPLLEDRQRIEDVKGLLAVDSSQGDQQVHQALTAVMGHFKGRATNLFYKDNAHYGDLVNRISGMASHAFTGRYSEADRKGIYDMLDGMQNTVIDPSLTRLEEGQKKHAQGYGLDPSQIEVQGDFNRVKAPATPAPATPAAAPTATKSIGGVNYYKKDGQWYKQ